MKTETESSYCATSKNSFGDEVLFELVLFETDDGDLKNMI